MSDNPSQLILPALSTRVVGRPLLHYGAVGSTNDLAREQARADHAEGLIIMADEQLAGRGRLGRGWTAPPGSSLLMSLLLRPVWLPPHDAFLLTMLAGVALCEAVEQVAPIKAALKWPNDLLLPVPQPDGSTAQRKAAGILSEIDVKNEQIRWVVVGMGVNVNWSPHGRVDGRDLAQSATSVSAAAGQPVDRMALLQTLLERLDMHYAALRRGQREKLFVAWRERLATLGTRITVRLPTGDVEGVAEAVEPSGALRLRDEHGKQHVVMAGEVGS
jgi:BirA family biotin operon repressor/biotin-[acetyl-CoA-carboxylase] ligase